MPCPCRGREPDYAARLRHMGVHVFPVMRPEEWMLQVSGRRMLSDPLWASQTASHTHFTCINSLSSSPQARHPNLRARQAATQPQAAC